MHPETIRDFAIQILDDAKASDIISLDVRERTTITDYMIICTGRSSRHTKAIGDTLLSKAKEFRIINAKSEGDQENAWILVDLGSVVVHIMLATTRDYYNLEDLWQPVENLRQQ